MSPGGTPIYRCNIAALRSRHPLTAERIDASPLPANASFVSGRDDAPAATYAEQGKTVWLGRTSMPRVTAHTQFGQATFGVGSVSLPGILTGVEALMVLERLAPAFAVFVVERRLDLVKLALHLHGYDQAIESGRLVFIREDALEEDFRILLDAYPGYDLPRHIVSALQRSRCEIESLQAGLEQTAGPLAAHQMNIVSRLATSIARPSSNEVRTATRFTVLAMDQSPLTWHVARMVTDAARNEGSPAECHVPDTPTRSHLAAQVQRIADSHANTVLCIGGTSAALRRVLPDSLPIISWYLPDSAVAAQLPALGTFDRVLAGSNWVRRQLHEIGVPEDRVTICPPGVCDLEVLPDRSPTAHGSGSTGMVRVLADLPDDRAESCGITVPSHARLWDALRTAARRGFGTANPPDLDQLMHQAATETGVKLTFDSVAAQLRGCAAERILPTAQVGAVVQMLSKLPGTIELYGHRMSQFTEDRISFCGAIPSGRETWNLFKQADLLVVPNFDGRAFQWSIDAIASGTTVLCCRTERFNEGSAEACRDILESIHWFDLPCGVRTFLHDRSKTGARVSQDSAAWSHEARAKHGLSQRIRLMRDVLGEPGTAVSTMSNA